MKKLIVVLSLICVVGAADAAAAKAKTASAKSAAPATPTQSDGGATLSSKSPNPGGFGTNPPHREQPAAPAPVASNPFFGDKQNQVQLILGQGFDSGELILFENIVNPAPYYMVALSYSQPNTFFRMPGRRTISAIKTLGWGYGAYNGTCHFNACDWRQYGNEIFMISQDFAWPFWRNKMYAGIGAGVAIQGQQNDRLNTKFLIPFRMFIGYHITESWNAELIMQHFSNGDTGEANKVYDFLALGISYNF